VWDAEIATHSDVAQFFSMDGSDLHLEEDYIAVNDLPEDTADAEAEQIGEFIKTHPAIVRIYGPDVTVNLEAPDSGQNWQF
jgi:hypothetical protein